MKLTILGSGSPEAHVRRASSGYLLEIGNQRVLFDCGGGVFDRLVQAGYKLSDIDLIFFSHLHSDHFADYGRLVHAAWDEAVHDFAVFGPDPIEHITNRLFGDDGVFAHDLRARTEFPPSQQIWVDRGGTLPRPWPNPNVTNIAPGFTYAGDGWTLEAFEVPHMQPALMCMGFKITAGGKTFVYSGDAGICDALTEAQQGADLLLHWCYRLDGEQVHPAVDELSPTPGDIARVAANSGVKRLLITHFRAHMDTDDAHSGALAAMARHFRGDARIVEDLDVYDI